MELFFTLFKASFKREAQYKFDFFVNILGNFLGLFADFLIIALILIRFQNIAGWQLHQVALMYAIIEFGFGVYRLIGEGFNRFEELILSGKFDTLLLRPVPVLVQVMLHKIDLKRLGMVVQAMVVGLWGIQRSTFPNSSFYCYLPLLLLASVIINLEVSIILAAMAFWTGKNKDIIILGHYSTRTAATYPATIYHKLFSHILTLVIPFFTVSYYPLLYYTGKSDNPFYLLTPLFGITTMTLLSSLIWRSGIKRYSSTGT